MCKQAPQQSLSGLMTSFPPHCPVLQPPQNVCFWKKCDLSAGLAVVQHGGRRLGQAGIRLCAHLRHLAEGWGDPGSHLHFPEQTNKQRPGVQSTELGGGG